MHPAWRRRLARRHLQGRRQLLPRSVVGGRRRRRGRSSAAPAEAFGTAPLAVNTGRTGRDLRRVDIRLYVNGAQVSSIARTGAITTSTNPLQIGGDTIYGQYFNGPIDEARIYNTALTAAQIQSDMAPGSEASSRPPADQRRRPTARSSATSAGHDDQPLLDGLDRQRRRHRLPCRALPGHRLPTSRRWRQRRRRPRQRPDGQHHLQLPRPRRPTPPATSGLHSNTATATTPAAPDTHAADRPALSRRPRSTTQINLSGPPRPTTWASPATRSSAARAPAAPPSPRSHNDRDQLQRHRPRPPAPATATASAPTTPPATTAATPTPPPPPPPTARHPPADEPGALSATATGTAQIDLAWTARRRPRSHRLRLERCQGTGCTTFAQIEDAAHDDNDQRGLTAARPTATASAPPTPPATSHYSNTATATTPDRPRHDGADRAGRS